MNVMDDHRLRDVIGRMVAESPDAVALEDLDHPLLGIDGRRSARVTPWVLAAGAAILIGGVVLAALVLSFTAAPTPTAQLPTAVGSPAPATLDQFDEVVRVAVAGLVDGPGFEALQTSFIDGHLVSAVWLDSRRNGDFVAIQRSDVDVMETAWWLLGEAPPPDSGLTRTVATIRVGETVFTATTEADGSAPWRTESRPDYPRGTTAIEMALLSDRYPELAIPDGADLTRQDLVGGGEVWAVETSFDGHMSVLRWFVDAAGGLVAHQGDLTDSSGQMGAENRIPVDSWVIVFTPVEDPAPIAAPDAEVFDVDTFELPEDFPIRG
ncbi:MAG TPA: hypothetical protein VJ938_08780 [Acidimicrobiia bacterium]|nr:hypothetical protein [Acidimicrobiia bacterium]